MKRALFLVALLAGLTAGKSTEPGAGQINERAGWPIFAEDAVFWEEDAEAVARRLGLPPESRTETDASYRLYPPDDARWFGRRPHSVALSAQDGKPVALNIVFANKGDSVGGFVRTGPGRQAPRPAEALRDYRRAIAGDEAALEKVLGDLFGPAEPERTGPGGGLREKSRRRDWRGHAFLLVSERDEYVALRLVPSAGLDGAHHAARIPARELRDRLAGRVERRANGDVVVGDIPMVDQGPKGFCVPATMERMLRHLGIPADMYLLAMAARTDPGGGTRVADVLAAVGQTARRHGRRVVSLPGSPQAAGVREWIEAGLPVLWAIKTSPAVDDLINGRTRERAQVADWSAWEESLKPARRAARRLARAGETGHVCLITGYNATTGEIALSDSWGPGYAERWITQEEAAAISQGSMAVVAW